MEYDIDFVKSFMLRALDISKQYQGPHDATLLLNCLLGLLIVPKESLFDRIPQDEFNSLPKWGIQIASVKTDEQIKCSHGHKPNLQQLVRHLRNAIAHFGVSPLYKKETVTGFRFVDGRNGFKAELS